MGGKGRKVDWQCDVPTFQPLLPIQPLLPLYESPGSRSRNDPAL